MALYVINQANQPAQAHIVYTKADRNLWYALSDANPNRSQEQPISIKRTDLGIPTSTAAAIAHLWRCMLCATRPDERSQNDKIVIHPVVAEFSLVNPDVQALFGQLPRTMGTHTEALYELTKQLITYCEAEPSKRVSLAQKIERDASALAAVVKSEEQTR